MPSPTSCSPHLRGCSRHHPTHPRGPKLLPDLAGMFPALWGKPYRSVFCSPNSRGWSRAGVPGLRHPHLLPAAGGWSLLMLTRAALLGLRGWSPQDRRAAQSARAVPRIPGDVPRVADVMLRWAFCSRTRGDVPLRHSAVGFAIACSLRPAGMSPRARWGSGSIGAASHSRRDGPCIANFLESGRGCSPHPWGWSLRHRPLQGRSQLLPACAGMVPSTVPTTCWPPAVPRSPAGVVRSRCDRGVAGELLPAPVGMYPPRPCTSCSSRSVLRIRGVFP